MKILPSLLLLTIFTVYGINFHSIRTVNAYIINIDDGLGRKFDGIGGLSGGGATSKLLINYPEPQRSNILDYLFLPGFGASLQIIKVEIGGDGQSTEGSEASHMHERWDENYNRGYEWWLLKEAKKRNPKILTYGLPWAWPGWVGNYTKEKNPYIDIRNTVLYIMNWIEAAKRVHSIHIDFIGIWNENNYNVEYIKLLRKTMTERGFKETKIVSPDGSWTPMSKDILLDSQLADSIFAIGAHYPGTNSDPAARKTNKPLWSSEDFSTFNDDIGAGCWARILNQNYVNGLMTSTISWNLIASYYDDLPFKRCALMTANEPWSGNYDVSGPIWITAHTTQFTEPGWSYTKHGKGVGKLDNGGSYVTLINPEENQLTIIIETMSHDHSICIRPELPPFNISSQTATFYLKGTKLSHIKGLFVRQTKFNFNGKKSEFFEMKNSVNISDGTFQINLTIDSVITLTTTWKGNKGYYPSPNSKVFPLPFFDDFERYKLGEEPFNFAPQVGSWEVVKEDTQFSRQMVQHEVIHWCGQKGLTKPINLGGNYNWTDINLKMDAGVTSKNGSSGFFLCARVDTGGCDVGKAKGVFAWFDFDNNKFQLTTALHSPTPFFEKSLQLQKDTWNLVEINLKNDQLQVSFKGSVLIKIKIPIDAPKNGFVGYGSIDFGFSDFDNVHIF